MDVGEGCRAGRAMAHAPKHQRPSMKILASMNNAWLHLNTFSNGFGENHSPCGARSPQPTPSKINPFTMLEWRLDQHACILCRRIIMIGDSSSSPAATGTPATYFSLEARPTPSTTRQRTSEERMVILRSISVTL